MKRCTTTASLLTGGLLFLLAATSDARPDASLASYTLFAQEVLDTNALHVVGGNVGVNAGQLIVHGGLDAPSALVAADTVTFIRASTCAVDELFANAAPSTPCGAPQPYPVPILGGATLRQACGYPSAFTCSQTANANVVVLPAETRRLAAGRYGSVTVDGATDRLATLVFEGGTYQLCNLEVTTDARILFAAPTTLQIVGDVKIGDGSFAGPAPGSGISGDDIRLFVDGAHVGFRKHSIVHARVCAPDAEIILNQRTRLVGQAVGHTIKTRLEAVVGPADGAADDCGNGMLEGDEDCDPPGSRSCAPGSPGGAFLTCGPACTCPSTGGGTTTTTIRTSSTTTTSNTIVAGVCGNGVKEGSEACDDPDFGDATCPGGSAGGALLACVDECTRIDTSACLAGPRELCGNCSDDDGNGEVDFEDAACCAPLRTFPMTVAKARVVPRGVTSKFRLRARLAQTGLAEVDPRSEEVFLQVRQPTGEELLCVRLPPSSFVRKRGAFRFRDRRALVESARGIQRAVIRIRPDGSVRMKVRGRRVPMTSTPAGPLLLTVGFRAPSGDGDNRCSTVVQSFRPGRRGKLQAP